MHLRTRHPAANQTTHRVCLIISPRFQECMFYADNFRTSLHRAVRQGDPRQSASDSVSTPNPDRETRCTNTCQPCPPRQPVIFTLRKLSVSDVLFQITQLRATRKDTLLWILSVWAADSARSRCLRLSVSNRRESEAMEKQTHFTSVLSRSRSYTLRGHE